MLKFIFDLDGTITTEETLPLIAEYFGVQEDIAGLTRATIAGDISFAESLHRRVNILNKIPVSAIVQLFETVSLYPKIMDFIQDHAKICAIATSNLDCWVNGLSGRLPTYLYSSKALVKANRILNIANILQKEAVVAQYKALGMTTVFIGDGSNDIAAMHLADISIAAGLTHCPAPGVMQIADYIAWDEETLCAQLIQLIEMDKAGRDWQN